MVAFLPDREMKFLAYDVIRKEVNIMGTYSASAEDFQRAIELTESGQVNTAAIVTHEIPIEEVERGFFLAERKENGAIKVVLSF